MQSLSRIFRHLDMAGCPPCTKALVTAVYRASQRGSRIKLSASAFQNGTDARHASEQGFVDRLEDGTIVLTEKAKGLIR